MPELLIELAGQTVSLTVPDIFGEMAGYLFGYQRAFDVTANHSVSITQTGDDSFLIETPFSPPVPDLKASDLPEFAMDAVIRGLVTDQSKGVILHAAAVERQGKAILVAGISGAGKSTLTAWLATNGFRYCTDEIVFVPLADPLQVIPFRRPLVLRTDSVRALEEDGFENSNQHTFGDKSHVAIPSEYTGNTLTPGAIVFPAFHADADISIRPLSPSQAALRLLENNLNGANLADGGLASLAQIANSTPSFELRYGEFGQLEGVLEDVIDDIIENAPDPKSWHRIHSAFGQNQALPSVQAAPPVRAPTKVNAATPSRGKFKLTIGMATYDDFDGVYFTLQSLRLNNPELMDDIEFLVIDNHPDGPCGDDLKALENHCKTLRYVPFTGQSGTAIRDVVFSEASGDFVLCMDCHVLLPPGVLKRLMDFLDAHPDSTDLYQGPLIYDWLDQISTHFKPEWNNGMYGTWGVDERAEDVDAEPFEVPMQGLGLFVCKRDSWPGFNLKFRGFGGEEGYIHEKFRQRGDRTLCLPFLRWLHRFQRPMGIPYRPIWEDRIRNYIIGHRELGLDEEPIERHFGELLGKEFTKRAMEEIDVELQNPFNRFDALRCINLDDRPDRYAAVDKRFEKIGISRLVKRFPAIKTPENHHIGCALSHRAIIADARQRGLQNILIFEDDAIFHDQIMEFMPAVMDELENTDWDILYLGGHIWGQTFDKLLGSNVFLDAGLLTASPAYALNHSIFDRILGELPTDHEAMAEWLEQHHGIDQYLGKLKAKKLLTEPMLSTQRELVIQLTPEQQEHYKHA